MEKIAVFADDAVHARRLLAPLLARGAADVHWILVACVPPLPRHVARCLPPGGRMRWRLERASALHEAVAPLLGTAAACERLCASGALPAQVAALRQRLGADLRLLDARRPRASAVLARLSADQPLPARPWAAPLAITSGLSLVLTLSD